MMRDHTLPVPATATHDGRSHPDSACYCHSWDERSHPGLQRLLLLLMRYVYSLPEGRKGTNFSRAVVESCAEHGGGGQMKDHGGGVDEKEITCSWRGGFWGAWFRLGLFY